MTAFLLGSPPSSGSLLDDLQALKNNRPEALRVVSAHRPDTLALLDELRDRFDASIHSARTRPEQRKVEYDSATLDLGIWLGKLYADVSGDARPWRRFTARKVRMEGTELLNARRYRQSVQKLNAALREADRLEDVWLSVITRLNLAYARIEMGEARSARDLCERAAKDADRLGPRAQALASFDLAATYLHLGQFAESIPYSQAAANYSRQIGIKLWEGNALMNIGVAYRQVGDLVRAQSELEAALAVMTRTTDKLGTGRTLYNLALVSADLNQYAKTADYLERALPYIQQVDLRHSHEIEIDPKNYYNPVHEDALRLLVETYTELKRPVKVAEHEAALRELLKTKPPPEKPTHTHADRPRG